MALCMAKVSLAAAVFWTACINSPMPRLVPMLPQEPDSLGWVAAAERIAQADGYITGRIIKLEEDWTYDDPCGLITIVRHGCDGTVTYKLHVENAERDKWLWAFTPAYGMFGLFVGERAVFVWRRTLAYRYQECKQHQGMSGYCGYDMLDALTGDLDVLPPTDSARVAALFGR